MFLISEVPLQVPTHHSLLERNKTDVFVRVRGLPVQGYLDHTEPILLMDFCSYTTAAAVQQGRGRAALNQRWRLCIGDLRSGLVRGRRFGLRSARLAPSAAAELGGVSAVAAPTGGV